MTQQAKERVIKLSDFHSGALEHLYRLVAGTRSEYAPDDARVEVMLHDIRSELDERYTQLEQEVPGWKR